MYEYLLHKCHVTRHGFRILKWGVNFCNNVIEPINIWERRGLRKMGGWKFTHFTSPGSAPGDWKRRGWWKVQCSLLVRVHIYCRRQNLKSIQVLINEMKQLQHRQITLSLTQGWTRSFLRTGCSIKEWSSYPVRQTDVNSEYEESFISARSTPADVI